MSKSVLHQILDRAGFSPVTKGNYEHVIDRWIEFAGADPIGWTRDKAQEFYDQMIDGGLAVQSANVYIASLRYVSRWYATKSGGIDFAIVQRQRGKKGNTRAALGEEPTISADELRAMLETCRGGSTLDLRDFALMVTAIETGMRRMSLRGMLLELTRVTKESPASVVPIKGPGGEETFAVPLSDTAWIALTPWLAWLRGQKVKLGPVFRRLSARVVRDQRMFELGDDALSSTGINELIEARAAAAGIRHINPHKFRHTFITWRTAAGLNPLQISAITGHKVSIVAVEGVSMRIGDMRTYFHADINRIRNTTPAWLVELAKEITSSWPA